LVTVACFAGASSTIVSLLEAPPRFDVQRPDPLWMLRRRNSIHVAIRFGVRSVLLRAAGLASDECEDV
jgi:hypothetical protein